MKRYLEEQMISVTMNKGSNDIIRYCTRAYFNLRNFLQWFVRKIRI
jgi:hypothetical protein